MICKVKFAQAGKSQTRNSRAIVREGREVYRHPKNYFAVLEFEGICGKFLESFWPEDIEKQDLFL
jgi:hypothetical protein